MASLGGRGGMREEEEGGGGGLCALYGWQRSGSIAEESGSVPRHAMWGSDGRVE